MPSLRLVRVGATILTLVSTAVLAPAVPAQADVLDVACTPPSSTTTTYDPPLTTTPQDATISRTTLYGPCVSATVPGLSSGVTITSFGVENRSCANLLAPSTTQFTITWNTGHVSTLTTNNTATIVGGLFIVTNTGTVAAGLFHGDSVVRTTQAPATSILLCLAGLASVSSIYSVGNLVITSLG